MCPVSAERLGGPLPAGSLTTAPYGALQPPVECSIGRAGLGRRCRIPGVVVVLREAGRRPFLFCCCAIRVGSTIPSWRVCRDPFRHMAAQEEGGRLASNRM